MHNMAIEIDILNVPINVLIIIKIRESDEKGFG